jgi:tetratricopeptide (TPR) repeat protein
LSSLFKAIGSGVAVLLLIVGAAALGYARWSHAIVDGDRALADGQLDRAIASYTTAEARFDAVPATRQLFAADYTHAVANHLWALYRLGRFDETIDRAERSPERAAPHFWAGCAFFEKARGEEKPDAQLGWLTRAEEELRRAVAAAPADWDTKYDYELTTRLAAALRKQPKTPPKQMMQLLRPPTPSGKPARKVG